TNLVGVSEQKKNTQTPDVPEQLRIRRDKRARMIEIGIYDYPVSVKRTTSLRDLRGQYQVLAEGESAGDADGVTYLEVGQETQDVVSIAGRLIFMRNTGKLCFATSQDGDGTQVQAMLSLAEVGEESLAAWKADGDLGDFIAVSGRVISSRRGERSVMASEWQMAAKSLRPMPVAFADMAEDTRVRQRSEERRVGKECRSRWDRCD